MKPNVVYRASLDQEIAQAGKKYSPPAFAYAFSRFKNMADVEPEDINQDILAETLSGCDEQTRAMKLAQSLDFQGRLLLWHATLGTPWGYFLFRTLQTQSRIIQNGMLRVTSEDPSLVINVPMMPWYKSSAKGWIKQIKSGGPRGRALGTILKTIRTWEAFELIVGTLFGYKQAQTGELKSPLNVLEKWLGAEEETGATVFNDSKTDAPACPMLGQNSLGVAAVLGGLARACIQNTTYLLESSGISLPSQGVYRASVGESSSLRIFRWGLEKAPASRAEYYPTFICATWLALWTPLHPLFAGTMRRMDWYSLHPGYRLARLSKLIQKEKLLLGSWQTGEIHSFWEQLCARLGWPSPNEMIRATLTMKKKDPLDEHFKMACELNMDDPQAIIRPGSSPEKTHSLLPYVYGLSDPGSEDADTALWFAIEAELYSISSALLFSTDPPRRVLPVSGDEIDLVGSPGELARDYFGLKLPS